MPFVVNRTPLREAGKLQIRAGRGEAQRVALQQARDRLRDELAVKRESRAERQEQRQAQQQQLDNVFRQEQADQSQANFETQQARLADAEAFDQERANRIDAGAKADRIWRRARDMRDTFFRTADLGIRYESLRRARQAEEDELEANATINTLVLEQAKAGGVLGDDEEAASLEMLDAVKRRVSPRDFAAIINGLGTNDSGASTMLRQAHADTLRTRLDDRIALLEGRLTNLQKTAGTFLGEMAKNAQDPIAGGDFDLDEPELKMLEHAQNGILADIHQLRAERSLVYDGLGPNLVEEFDQIARRQGRPELGEKIINLVRDQVASRNGTRPEFVDLTNPAFELAVALKFRELGYRDYSLQDIRELEQMVKGGASAEQGQAR